MLHNQLPFSQSHVMKIEKKNHAYNCLLDIRESRVPVYICICCCFGTISQFASVLTTCLKIVVELELVVDIIGWESQVRILFTLKIDVFKENFSKDTSKVGIFAPNFRNFQRAHFPYEIPQYPLVELHLMNLNMSQCKS